VLLIYDKTLGNIYIAYSGFNTSPNLIFSVRPELKDFSTFVLLPDDPQILKNSRNYRVVTDKGSGNLSCVLKARVNLQFKDNKNIILSDGVDSTTLLIQITEGQEGEIIDVIVLYFNDAVYPISLINNEAEVPITSTTPGEIKISVNDKLYRHDSLILEVQQ
jgi:hypothetical protein